MAILTCAELLSRKHDIELPFQLELIPDGGDRSPRTIEITRLLRLLPGVRLTGLTVWEDEPAIVKLFYQPGHWKRHVEREQRGNRHLMDARVSTPPLQEVGKTADGNGAFLINKYLEPATKLGNLLGSGELNLLGVNTALIEKVIALISRCHEIGVWQQDIHLDNLIIQNGRTYFLDGASVNVETPGAALGESNSLNNLARFFAQFPVDQDAGIERFYDHYRQCRTQRQFRTTPQQFVDLVRHARLARLDICRDKSRRPTSAHCVASTPDYFMVADRRLADTDLEQFARDPDALIEQGRIIKPGDTSTVAIVDLNGRQLVLKRYNLKDFWHRIKRFFGKSRAFKSWRSGLMLQTLGIATPAPLLMLECRKFGLLRGKTYILTEHIEGRNILDQAADGSLDAATQEAISTSIAELFRTMHDYQFSHGDMKASNFIFRDGKLYLLDLDATAWHGKPASFKKAIGKDLRRWNKNWIGRNDVEELAHKAHNLLQHNAQE